MATKISRLWFVIPNDIKGTGQTWQGAGQPNVRLDDFRIEPARPRAARGAPVEEPEAPADSGVGLYLSPKESKEIVAFTTKTKATEYAKYQATMNPQKLFGVFSCDQVFETTTPNVLEKKFNDAGELVLSGV
jgi:hypothetical protein